MMNENCDMFNSTPPWLLGKPPSCMEEVTLHDEIQLFCKWISPTREEQMMRESVIVRISCVVCQLWPTAQVKTYGSYATQLYLPNSDVDLCVTGAPPGSQSLVTLAEVLRAKELSTQLHVISSAKVPIIKLTDKVSGSIVDISLNQDVRTNELVGSYMERYPALRPLTLILKSFLFQRRLHESYTGGLSSFSLLIIIVSFFQFHVPDSTSKTGLKVASKANLGNLLMDFFKFYGKQFDYEHVGISIRDSGSFFPKMSRNWYDPFNPCVFSLESPLDQTSDVGRGGFATPRVVAAFAKAYEDLTSNSTPRLSSVLIVDSTIIERRSHIMSLYARQTASPPHTHRTQRSVSATAAMQTVSSPFKTSISIPIPSNASSIAISTPNSSAPNNTTSTNENTSNPLFLSTSAPAHPLSPPSPPTSHTPIHISPATSPRIPPTQTSTPLAPFTHPTIAGFDAKTNTDSSTDTDTDTDGDADLDTDSGDHSGASSSSANSYHEAPAPLTTPPIAAPLASVKAPFYNMSGLDYYLRTMQNHFQSLQPTLSVPSRPKMTKSAKRNQKLLQLQQQLAQHVGMGDINADVQNIIAAHVNNANNNNNNNNNSTKGTKKDKNRNNCINSNSPTASTPPSKPCIISDSLPPTPPTATTTTRGRRNSNPQSRKNSNPPARRNSNPNSRRNSNPPPVTTTSTASPLSTCSPIPEIETLATTTSVPPSTASTPTLNGANTTTSSASTSMNSPNATQASPPSPTPTNATPPANGHTSDFYNKSKGFARPNAKQQRWAPKASNSGKKLNLLQSCSVPVSN